MMMMMMIVTMMLIDAGKVVETLQLLLHVFEEGKVSVANFWPFRWPKEMYPWRPVRGKYRASLVSLMQRTWICGVWYLDTEHRSNVRFHSYFVSHRVWWNLKNQSATVSDSVQSTVTQTGVTRSPVQIQVCLEVKTCLIVKTHVRNVIYVLSTQKSQLKNMLTIL